MGKQKKLGLGQSLNSNIKKNRLESSNRHTTGSATKDFATLHSCTQENDLDSFLRTASLANTDFTAEKLNVKVINHQYSEAIPSPDEQSLRQQAFNEHRNKVRIPRRPPWTKEMSKEELDQNERDAFITWRQSLAGLQENQHVILTPFEKNLEVWRQLWRVVERSDVIIQIVDARDPLLYWCEDLQKYVKENGQEKQNILLVNKADYLSDSQRHVWSSYLKSQNFESIFYSAINELSLDIDEECASPSQETDLIQTELLDDEEMMILSNFNKFALLSPTEDAIESEAIHESHSAIIPESSMQTEGEDVLMEQSSETNSLSENVTAKLVESSDDRETTEPSINHIVSKIDNGEILSSSELLTYLSTLRSEDKDAYMIGLVGYPNVGKSSTLNSLLREKRVQVSATPGKTKHFQTFKMVLESGDATLCDCPGLVFPNLASSKSEMFCSGILPIDHMRDNVGPMSYLIDKIPRIVLESVYGITLPLPDELEKGRLPYPHEVLREYGTLRGFMTTHGTPDESKAARIILKDYVNGKLLHVKPPPNYASSAADFNPVCEKYMQRVVNSASKVKKTNITLNKESVESEFFKPREVQMHVKGRTAVQNQGEVVGKPWKKHYKGKSKEKTKRKVPDLNY